MRRARIGRILRAAAAVLLLAGGLAVTGAYLYLRTSVRTPSGTRSVGGGLGDTVRVAVDSFAVPHVYAASLHDAFFAQGYLHASHRLWQMEVLRRTARGRLAEVLGPEALDADRLLRTLDLWGAAGRSLGALSSGERRLLEAYAAGVNSRLRRWDGPLPPEFVLLGFEPEPWSPRASLAVGKVMALDLSPFRRELSRYHAARVLEPEKLDLLRTPYPSWAPTILRDSVEVPEAAVGSAGGAPRSGDPGAPRLTGPWGGRAGPAADAGEAASDALELLARLTVRSGSNAWVVSGARTRGGHPIVANDMHLGLRAPAIWYVAGLHAARQGVDVAGFTLPGVPGVIVGFNRRVAWGFTNGMVDDMDFAVETVSDDGGRYRDGGRWRRFRVRAETLRVRGREEPVVHRVRETVRGPVITDALTGLGGTLSARWVGSRATTEVAGILAMNRAGSAEAFDRGLGRFDSPQQNVVYATVDGRIGYRLSGSVPLRPARRRSLPAPAGELSGKRPELWPPERLPAARDPARDFIATANNLQAPNLRGVLGTDYPLPFRARRIADRLAASSDWTPRKIAALALDTRSLFAGRVRERAVRAARRAGRDSAARLLSRWDLHVDVRSRGAPVFYAWLYRLRDLLAADEYPDPASPWAYFPDGALLRILEGTADDGGWTDRAGTEERERLEELEVRAMEEAAPRVLGRTWGQVHREKHAHLLGRSGLLDLLFGFDVGPHPAAGAPRTVRPDDYQRWEPLDGTAWRPPYLSDYGPSERFVVELDPAGPRAWFLLPTGQSGNPFSRHYRDMAGRWWAEGGDGSPGALVSLPLDREEVAGRTVRRFTLVPPGKNPERARNSGSLTGLKQRR